MKGALTLVVIFAMLMVNTSALKSSQKDLQKINMIFLAEQVIQSYPIFRQLVQDIDRTQDQHTILMDLLRIYSHVDQFAQELHLNLEMLNSTNEEFVDTQKCLQGAQLIADHLRKMTDDTDVVGNLQIISTVADYVPQALVDCGVSKTERKFKKYKSSYVRTKIDPESIE